MRTQVCSDPGEGNALFAALPWKAPGLISGCFPITFSAMNAARIIRQLTLCLLVAAVLPLSAGGGDLAQQQQDEVRARELLMRAKDALSSGNVEFLRQYLAPKTYLNLFTGVNGYFSNEQAWLILESFFLTYEPVSFSFSSRNFSIRNPYGFGPFTYQRRGQRGTAEIFLSLANLHDDWKFSQITIARR